MITIDKNRVFLLNDDGHDLNYLMTLMMIVNFRLLILILYVFEQNDC